MGNEKSALRGLEIEDKAVEITDYWMHYDASIRDSNLQKLSIFISEPSLHFTASFGRPSPLERAAKVLYIRVCICVLKTKFIHKKHKCYLYLLEFHVTSASLYFEIYFFMEQR